MWRKGSLVLDGVNGGEVAAIRIVPLGRLSRVCGNKSGCGWLRCRVGVTDDTGSWAYYVLAIVNQFDRRTVFWIERGKGVMLGNESELVRGYVIDRACNWANHRQGSRDRWG